MYTDNDSALGTKQYFILLLTNTLHSSEMGFERNAEVSLRGKINPSHWASVALPIGRAEVHSNCIPHVISNLISLF